MHASLYIIAVLLLASFLVSTIGCKKTVPPVSNSGGLKHLVFQRHVPEPDLRNSNAIIIGEIHRLVSERRLVELRALLRSKNLEIIRPELFYRDYLQQTPLSIAWKRRDKEFLSLLLSVGKFHWIVGLYLIYSSNQFNHITDIRHRGSRINICPRLLCRKSVVHTFFAAYFYSFRNSFL